jgi:CRISPR-associated endonuclease Csn1
MAKVLGLDLGTNSIGWALIDDEKNEILRTGSRIFPEGVENLGEGEGRETSKNASRTDARGTRRQFFRRRLRRRYLLRELAKNNLCPIDFNLVKVWTNNEVFNDEQFKEWIRLNPYELRAKAIQEEITLFELGRIFYHMIQRRGFLSNSRSAGSEDNEKSVIFKGDAKIGKIGIAETQGNVEENKTLGTYLNQIQPKENEPYQQNLERIRNRYTTRQMYIDEFEQIWEKQKSFHAELTDELKSLLGGRKKDGYRDDGVLFHQRPLRSQKHLVGNCTFEPKKTKCQLSAIPFEEFRTYQWVNTVECNGKKLSEQEREILVNQLFTKVKADGKINFMALRKAIKKADSSFQFNYKDDDKIVGTHTISQLSNKKFFGAGWFDLSEKEQEDIWHVLYFFEDRDKLKEYAKKNWNFDEVKAEKISKFNLKDGYANLSRKAINNILPFLKQGILYDKAVVLGGIKNVFGEEWDNLENKQAFIDTIDEIAKKGEKGGFIDKLKEYLKTDYNLSENQLNKLYHHSATINAQEILDKLPLGKEADKEIQSIRNPIVTTALFEIRKLVNEIIDDYGKPNQIKVELARDLKISKTKRNEIRREQKRLEGENDRVKAELDYIGQRYSHDNILKYKLWEECNKTCPYTGRQIEVSQLFTGEVQIEHIFPWSRSLNDSFMNKTLCFADENRAKGDLTPYEFYSKKGDEIWETKKAQALSCFKNKKGYPNAYQKFKQFVKQKHDSDFISRQLNDTRYISKEAKNYLGKICNDVQVAPGQMTANLRQKWGLNTILNDENTKSRDDHRHHAVDALVMACSTRSHLQELTKWNRYRNTESYFPMPWETFRQDAEKAIDQILVSHKKMNNLLTIRTTKVKKGKKEYTNVGVAARGQLHLDTVYGKRKDVFTGKEAYHVRKQVSSLTPAEIPKIVDASIHKLVEKRIEDLGLKINEKDRKPIVKSKEEKKLFEQLFNEPLFLTNRNGADVPIKKIRIKKNFGNAVALDDKEKQWVDLGKNHHVLIYKDEKGELKEEVVTFWTAVERKKQKQDVVQLPPKDKNGEIITTLQINDTFLLGLKEEDINWEENNKLLLIKHLYKVQTLSKMFYEFRLHSDSTQVKDTNSNVFRRIQSFGEGKTGWLTFNPIKVKITPTGKIEKL